MFKSLPDSPVYLRAQQQQRHQQTILMQQRPLERTESGSSFNILRKKRLISSTRSDPGSPNILISTSAISDSPVDSNCSTPQRYEMGIFNKTNFKMWGIDEVSSVNENSGNRNPINDDEDDHDEEDHNELILVYTETAEHSVQHDEKVNRLFTEDHTVQLDHRSNLIESQSNETPELGLRLTEDDCNHSSLYSFVLSKRKSQSTCCILQQKDSGSSVNDPVFLIEHASPQIILNNHESQPGANSTVYCNTNCANHCGSLSLVDNYNNNCKEHKSSQKLSSTETKADKVDKQQKPISKSFSLFNNSQNQQNSTQKSLSPISNTESVRTSHSSLFNLFNSNGAKQRICSFKLNKRSLSNDK